MSARDTLKRKEQEDSSATSFGFSAGLSRAQARLTEIMTDISSGQIEDYLPYIRTTHHRNPSAPLRWFILTDVLALVTSFFMAWLTAGFVHVAVLLDRPFPRLGIEGDLVSFSHFAFVSLGIILWFVHSGHYRQRMPFWVETQKILMIFSVAMLAHGFLQFSAKQDFSRLWLMGAWVFAAADVMLLRNLARYIMRRTGLWQVRTLLVGGGSFADQVRVALRSEPDLGYEVAMQIEHLHLILGHIDGSWERLCKRFSAEYVVVALEGDELKKADEAVDSLVRSGVPFSIAPPLRHLPVLGISSQTFFSHDIFLMVPVDNIEQVLPRFLKRSMDMIASGLALLLLSPFFVLFSLWIKKDGGPAFYADLRVGANGTAFYCLKFRSMVMNGDEVFKKYLQENPEKNVEWETYHKLRDGDPRVTSIGAFLRRWSLDELPQLINVLRGDMSLVGPRPIMFRERGAYNKALTHYARVRPGLTGIWQISGRSDVSFARRVQMDAWYVQNWSLWTDVIILFKTLPVLLKKTGAY